VAQCVVETKALRTPPEESAEAADVKRALESATTATDLNVKPAELTGPIHSKGDRSLSTHCM